MPSPEMSKTRALNFQHALRLRMAEYWLALGQLEEALREFSQLPLSAQKHPDVVRMRERFSCLPPHILEMWLPNAKANASHRKGQKRVLATKQT